MKKLILAALLACGFFANADLKETDSQYVIRKNFAQNGGFENALGKWTSSGGSFTATTGMIGSGAAIWDSSAANQTLSNAAFTVPPGLMGQFGEFSCLIKTPSGTATHTLEAYDGSSAIGSQTVVSSTTAVRTRVPVKFPSSGTIRLRLKAVNANEPAITIDDCFVGTWQPSLSVTTTQRNAIANPIAGLEVYNSTLAEMEYYDGSNWLAVGSTLSGYATYRSVTTTDAVGATDETMKLSGTSFTSTLPTAVGIQGKRYKFIHAGTTFTNIYTIATTSSQTVGGLGTGVWKLSTAGEVLIVESDNANWMVVSHQANTAPASYSPSLSSPFGTVSASSFFWQRLGNLMIVWGSFTAGTTAANIAAIPLPGGVIDSTALARGNTTSANGHIVGTYAQNSSGNSAFIVTATGTSTSNVYVGGIYSSAGLQQIPQNGNSIATTGGIISVEFRVPISTWQP